MSSTKKPLKIMFYVLFLMVIVLFILSIIVVLDYLLSRCSNGGTKALIKISANCSLINAFSVFSITTTVIAYARVFVSVCNDDLCGMITSSFGMKVNMEGTLRLGKEVLDTLSDYFGMTFRSSRRSFLPVDEDSISSIVRSAAICRSETCGNMKKYLDEYIVILAKTIQNILEKALGSNFKQTVYEKQLKHYLDLINDIVIIKSENDVNEWLSILKKINAKFQELASIYVNDIDVDTNNLKKAKNDLHHAIILATVIVETNYINTLCTEYNMCMKIQIVTKTLSASIETLSTASEAKVKSFLQVFYKALFETTFYQQIDEATAHKLQLLLYGVAYSKDILAKNVVSEVQKVVDENLKLVKSDSMHNMSQDLRLLHVILSDLDLIFAIQSSDPFAGFLNVLYEWLKSDVDLHNNMHKVMFEIKKKISTVSNDLFHKLITEIRVLLNMYLNSNEDT